MHLPKFEHLCPASVDEATQLLRDYGPRALLVAGGTDLYPRMKHGLARPEVVISLKGVPINPPSTTQNGDLHLDAQMTLADVARSPVVLEKATLLAEAALNVGSNQIRHMGTLGGNLCLETRCAYYNQSHSFQFVEPCFKRDGHRCYLIPKGKKCQAVFMGDTVPALICLGAKIEIKGTNNSRQLPVEKLYTGDALRPLALSYGEIVSGVIIPNSFTVRSAAFTKFSLRGGLEFAALTVAVLLDMEDNGKSCASARIVVGAVAPKPIRAVKAEAALTGRDLSSNLFQEVAQKVVADIPPVMHHGYSVPFLRECLGVQTFRTLALAGKRIRRD